MSLLLNVFIGCVAALLVAPALPRGRVRRAFELVLFPFVRLGLWYRWSMYAPEAPTLTRMGAPGILYDDGRFEVVRLPGFDDDQGFGRNGGMRFIAFQWALCDPMTAHLRPAVGERALEVWRRSAKTTASNPVALEIRVFEYPSPPPGAPHGAVEPKVRTVWSRPLSRAESASE